MSVAQRRQMVDLEHPKLSIERQCALLEVSRSSLYYRPRAVSAEDLSLMGEIDRQYLETPFIESRRMTAWLERRGMPVQRLMRAICWWPGTSRRSAEHPVYPYLLRNLRITRPNRVWAADITCLPMARGFLYSVAVMDGHGRYVLAWRLSNTLEAGFCAEALEEALAQEQPEVFNTGQGSQFTSLEFTQVLQDRGVRISMDGKGRYQDNIFVERLWRTVKYEEVYLRAYASILEARWGLEDYFRFYNGLRPHQGLGYWTPAEVYRGARGDVDGQTNGRRCSPGKETEALPEEPKFSRDLAVILSK